MTKDDIKRGIAEGKTLAEILSYNTKNQECTIFKDSWPEDKDLEDRLYDVVYVPDITLNEADSILLNCYTVRDFLQEAHGCVALAKDIYTKCNGQHPDVNDILDCTDNEKFEETYHNLSWDEIVSRDNGIRFLRMKLYYLYQLNWMISHGYSIFDLIECLEDIHDEYDEDMDDKPNDAGGYIRSLYDEFEEEGFQGELWVSYYEFLQTEYLDWDFSAHLIKKYAMDFSIHLTNRYTNDKTMLFGGLYEIDRTAITSGEPCEGYYPYF